jgi:hypothetical protein
MNYIGTGRLGSVQNAAYTASSAVITNPVGSQTYKVRLVATTDCYVKIGDGSPTATMSDTYLPALSAEYFTITPGQKVAAVRVVADGTLNVTEVS